MPRTQAEHNVPGGTENSPLTDTGKRQYRLKSQAFVGSTDIQNARMLLEVPVLRMPNVFLELAEEARKSVMVDDQLTDKKDVQSHRTGQAKPVFVTEQYSSIGEQVIPIYQSLNRVDPR